MPFFEPQLREFYDKAMAQANLVFTADVDQAVREADVIFICVNTPPK
jgi:UDPglucose 6-dehydrogenase